MNQYHPKLLKIFTYEQLELLADHSFCQADNKDRIFVLFSNMNFGSFEIDCDPDEERNNGAVIHVLFNTTWEGENIGIEEFWELYSKSSPVECESICIGF